MAKKGLTEKRTALEQEKVEQVDKVCKDTVEKILKELKFVYKERAKEYTNWDGNKVQAVTLDWLNADLEEIAEDYGVEIEG